MKRHEGLIPLSHDHHQVLAHARRLKGAAFTGEGLLDKAREFIGFFDEEGIRHFREEEELIFPLASSGEGIPELVLQALAEHVYIHRLVFDLRSEVADGAVDADLARNLAETLQDHVRLEEKVIFPMIERVAPESLKQLAAERMVASGAG